MSDQTPRTLPQVEGVRNPRRQAVADALRAEIDAQKLNVRCLSKVTAEVDPSLDYMPMLAIVNGTRNPSVDQLSTICNVLAIRLEDLVAKADGRRG